MDVFDSLQTLDRAGMTGRIRVRVTRMWASTANDGFDFLGMNMILLDAEDFHVHAFASPGVWQFFDNIVEEGNIYNLGDFTTAEATGTLRPVSSGIKILFTYETSANQVIIRPNMPIPLYKFELKDIDELYDDAHSYLPGHVQTFAPDVIGVVCNIEQKMDIQTIHGTRSCQRFMLSNGRRSVKVILWDAQVNELEPLLQGGLQAPAIIIFASCKITKFPSFMTLTYIPSSRIYINIPHDAVNNMRARILSEGE